MLYTVYFEIFGKKMKTKVEASSDEDAKYKVMGKIIWHKIEPEPLADNDVLDFLKGTFGLK